MTVFLTETKCIWRSACKIMSWIHNHTHCSCYTPPPPLAAYILNFVVRIIHFWVPSKKLRKGGRYSYGMWFLCLREHCTGTVFACLVFLGNFGKCNSNSFATPLNRTLQSFIWNIPKKCILEFGVCWWSICLAVFYLYIFWEMSSYLENLPKRGYQAFS